MQRKVDPRQRPAGGHDAPVLDQRGAPGRVGARVAAFQFVVPPPCRRAAPPVEQARLAQQEHAIARAADDRSERMLMSDPRSRRADRRRRGKGMAEFAEIAGNEDRGAFADLVETRVDVQPPAGAVFNGTTIEAHGRHAVRFRLAALRDHLAGQRQHIHRPKHARTQTTIEGENGDLHMAFLQSAPFNRRLDLRRGEF